MSFDSSGEIAWGGDAPPELPDNRYDSGIDVPHHLDTLPDGSDTLVIGDVEKRGQDTHLQGDNPFGFRGTCGLVSCEGVLRHFGLNVSEADIVAHAVMNDQCHVGDDPARCGGTSASDQARILTDYGVPAHVETASSIEDLAAGLEEGRGVIIEANAGVLWDQAEYYEQGQANHAVVATGVARDPQTGQIQGFFINDSGTGQAGRFVDAATMEVAWLEAGGVCVVTDAVRID
ncbi:C39 family peptidase [Microbispora sp. NBC_01189]|uniref:C39 family peptidase n=1 Tax=Microbispora sp. NBC_01189 TaxID=2903583 RepID=UPI002E125D37|nr:C39 family peptidase [Microbispora sp. NBC_01189]